MIYIVLPAYNEAEDLGELICGIDESMGRQKLAYRTIVVDDGSTDTTCALAMSFKGKYPVDVIQHQVNKGLGEAIKTGLTYVAKVANPDDVLVVMDADNTHSPDFIGQMNAKIQEGADLVLASRYRKDSRIIGLSLYRNFLSNGASFLFRTFLPVRGVRDYTNGFRAYKVSLVRKAFEKYGDGFVTERGFSCMVDILIKLGRLSPIIEEVPFTLYYNKKKGCSKMDIGKSVKTTLKLLIHNITKK